MSDPFEIRRLQAVDAEDYRAIRLAALKTQPQAFGAVHADEASRPAAHFAERIATSTVLGAYHQAQIVGMIWLKQEVGAKVSHNGLILGLLCRAVPPAARNRVRPPCHDHRRGA